MTAKSVVIERAEPRGVALRASPVRALSAQHQPGQDAAVLDGTRKYLEHGTDITALASELHLHRTTIYSRSRRLQERYGMCWENPDDRLATIVGLRIDQLHRLETHKPAAGRVVRNLRK